MPFSKLVYVCMCLYEVCANVYRSQRLMLGVIFYPKLFVPLQLLCNPYLLVSVFSNSHIPLVNETQNSKEWLALGTTEVPSKGYVYL